MTEFNELAEALSFEKFFENQFCQTYGYQFEPFQREIARTLQRERFTLTKVARGHGKTELGVAYAIWYAKYNPGSHIVIVSSALDQSTRILARIKDRLTDIGSLQYLLPSTTRIGIGKFKNRDWSKTSITLANQSQIRCVPFSDTIRGTRNDVIIADDILRSDGIMPLEDAINLFNDAFIPSLQDASRSQIHIFGTPISSDDLLSYFEKTGEFVVNEYPAIVDGKPLMPSRFKLEDLEKLKRIMGEISFSREYMLKPIPTGASIFQPSLIEKSVVRSHPDSFDFVVMGVDVAMSDRADADYTAVAVVGVKDGIAYVVDVTRHKGLSAEEHEQLLYQLYKLYDPDEIIIEKNGIAFSLVEELEKAAILPIVPYRTTRVNKEVNIGRILSMMEQGKLKFLPFTNFEIVRDELVSIIPKRNGRIESASGHDDTVMAIALALSSESLIETPAFAVGLVRDGKMIPVEKLGQSGNVLGEVI